MWVSLISQNLFLTVLEKVVVNSLLAVLLKILRKVWGQRIPRFGSGVTICFPLKKWQCILGNIILVKGMTQNIFESELLEGDKSHLIKSWLIFTSSTSPLYLKFPGNLQPWMFNSRMLNVQSIVALCTEFERFISFVSYLIPTWLTQTIR